MPENGSKKILIADNDEEILIAFEHALETAGYVTAVALNAEEMFWMLSRADFALVVLDDYFSDEDCSAVLARFQITGIRPPVVVTHHRYPTYGVQEKLRTLGASAFVNKRALAGLPHIAHFLLQSQKPGNDEFRRAG
jgi:DNA-binding NtrC family response regulator